MVSIGFIEVCFGDVLVVVFECVDKVVYYVKVYGCN